MKREDLKEYFQTAGPSDAQKEQMLAGVLERYETQSRDACADKGDMNMNVSMKKRISEITVIAAVIVLTTVTAFAEVPDLRNWIGERFGLNEEQTEVLSAAGILQNVEASAADGMRTLTVRQTMADENGMYIVYDVDSADGSAVKADADDFTFRTVDSQDVSLYGYEQQVLEERTDGVTCMAMLFGVENLSGQEVSMTSCGLTCQWTVGEMEAAKTQDVSLWGKNGYDGSYHVSGYSLSPLFLKLNLEDLGEGVFAAPHLVQVELEQMDGSTLTIQTENSFGKKADGICYNLYIFDEVIDVDAVKAIYVDGVKLK